MAEVSKGILAQSLLVNCMTCKYGISKSPTHVQGLALINWMLVISIIGVLVYLAILTYHISVCDAGASKRISQAFGALTRYSEYFSEQPCKLAHRRAGLRLDLTPWQQSRHYVTEIVSATDGIRHGIDAGTTHDATLELKVPAPGHAAVTKTLRLDWIPCCRGITTRCNQGVVS